MNPVRILLVAINAGLMVTFWFLANQPIGIIDDAGQTPYQPVTLSVSEEAVEPARKGVSRSLFRIPSSTASDSPETPHDLRAPDVRLQGVIVMDGRQVALVEHDGVVMRMEQGDDLDGWKLTAIEARVIRFDGTAQGFAVVLDVPTNAAHPDKSPDQTE